MPKARRGWTMPDEDARSMLTMIEERIRASDIQVEHRDALIRLRAMIEGYLGAFAGSMFLRKLRRGGRCVSGARGQLDSPSPIELNRV